MGTVRVLVERLDGSLVAQMVDGPDLARMTRWEEATAGDVWDVVRDAMLASSGTRLLTLVNAQRAIGLEPCLSRVRVRRVLASHGRAPRRLRSEALGWRRT